MPLSPCLRAIAEMPGISSTSCLVMRRLHANCDDAGWKHAMMFGRDFYFSPIFH